ncbi:hypothetical protein WJ966_21525 [Achromobacter xylosoxidans]
MHIQDDKSSFLAYELGLLSLKAALSTRAKSWPIYSASCKEHQRNDVKAAFRTELSSLATIYAKGPVSEGDHMALISALADRISCQHEPSLYKGRFRHGVAQKLVNIHLKYLWAAGVIPEPPHCPIDGIIRDLAGLKYDWTVSDSVAEYEAAIAALRCGRSLEHWLFGSFRSFVVGHRRDFQPAVPVPMARLNAVRRAPASLCCPRRLQADSVERAPQMTLGNPAFFNDCQKWERYAAMANWCSEVNA